MMQIETNIAVLIRNSFGEYGEIRYVNQLTETKAMSLAQNVELLLSFNLV